MGGGRWPWRHALCGRKAAPEGGPSQCQTAASQRPRCIALGDGDPCIGSDPDHDGFRPQSLTMRHGITSFRWLRYTNNLGAEVRRGKARCPQTLGPQAMHKDRHFGEMVMRGMIDRVVGAAVLAVVAAGAPARAQAGDVLVFAAASLKNAMDDAVSAFEKTGGDKVRVSYGASSALAKQIEAAAPADMFVSADLAWMDYLQQRSLIQPQTRKSFLGNRLVMVEPATSDLEIDIAPNF